MWCLADLETARRKVVDCLPSSNSTSTTFHNSVLFWLSDWIKCFPLKSSSIPEISQDWTYSTYIYYIKLETHTFWNLLPRRPGGMFSLTGENSKYIGFFVPGSESLNWSLFGSWPLLGKGIESFVDKMWASGTLHPGLKRFRRWKVIMTDFQWSPSNCVTQTFNQTSYCSIIFCCLCVSMYGNTFWWIVTA